jgi:hypothetical protein
VARTISDLSKAMGAHLYKEKQLPVCWKRSGLATNPWHPVVPEAKRSIEKLECSSLSNSINDLRTIKTSKDKICLS